MAPVLFGDGAKAPAEEGVLDQTEGLVPRVGALDMRAKGNWTRSPSSSRGRVRAPEGKTPDHTEVVLLEQLPHQPTRLMRAKVRRPRVYR